MTKIKLKKISRDEYAEALLAGIYEISFQKKDGSVRVMYCTLVPGLIPKTINEIEKEFIAKAKKKTSETSLSVYDLVNNEWRAFRTDSVITFKKLKLNQHNKRLLTETK